MLKSLRITVTALSLMACLLLIVLWVRSYYWRERVVFGLYGERALQLGHVVGQVRLITFSEPGLSFWQPDNSHYGRSKLPLDEWRQGPWRKDLPESRLGFDSKIGGTGWLLYVPYWFVVVLAIATGVIPWIKWHFSVRTLLIATTLLAVVLGLIVMAR